MVSGLSVITPLGGFLSAPCRARYLSGMAMQGRPAFIEDSRLSTNWNFFLHFDDFYDLQAFNRNNIGKAFCSGTINSGSLKRGDSKVEIQGGGWHRGISPASMDCAWSWDDPPEKMRETIEACGGVLTSDFDDHGFFPDWHTLLECFVKPGTEITITERHTESNAAFKKKARAVQHIHWRAGDRAIEWEESEVDGKIEYPMLPIWYTPRREWPESLHPKERCITWGRECPPLGIERGAEYGTLFG